MVIGSAMIFGRGKRHTIITGVSKKRMAVITRSVALSDLPGDVGYET